MRMVFMMLVSMLSWYDVHAAHVLQGDTVHGMALVAAAFVQAP